MEAEQEGWGLLLFQGVVGKPPGAVTGSGWTAGDTRQPLIPGGSFQGFGGKEESVPPASSLSQPCLAFPSFQFYF